MCMYMYVNYMYTHVMSFSLILDSVLYSYILFLYHITISFSLGFCRCMEAYYAHTCNNLLLYFTLGTIKLFVVITRAFYYQCLNLLIYACVHRFDWFSWSQIVYYTFSKYINWQSTTCSYLVSYVHPLNW